ncbi:rRNA-processing protein and EBNA1-binding protein ebp2 [Agyrium rufum]|nr:rRNA-processing protein and EBNA1-binding protein ebp2 [Agyrium rufum]
MEDDIAFSDVESLSSMEEATLTSRQRLTINNIPALLAAHDVLGQASNQTDFSDHQCLIAETATHDSILDINDDLTRELALYKQCLDACIEARGLLRNEKVSFTRPTDYFAEMLKSDEHMDKIHDRMHHDAAHRKAAAEAKKQRELKKFGKQVQVAKLQERDREKRATLDRIQLLKRKRRGSGITGETTQEEDLFDVSLQEPSKDVGRGGSSRSSIGQKQRKDAKYGHGGKKRFGKSGDAVSSGDLRNYSVSRMKGKRFGVSQNRLGKTKRAKNDKM